MSGVFVKGCQIVRQSRDEEPDVFALLDPNNFEDVALIMNGNPSSVPAEPSGYASSNDQLYCSNR